MDMATELVTTPLEDMVEPPAFECYAIILLPHSKNSTTDTFASVVYMILIILDITNWVMCKKNHNSFRLDITNWVMCKNHNSSITRPMFTSFLIPVFMRHTKQSYLDNLVIKSFIVDSLG